MFQALFEKAEGLVLACGLGLVAALTVPRTVIHYRAASSPSFAHTHIKDKTTAKAMVLSLQGRKDLNPRHAVLETAVLPTELHPYIKFFGTGDIITYHFQKINSF